MYVYLENDLADLDLGLKENEPLLDFLCDLVYKSFKGKIILDGKRSLRSIAQFSSDDRMKSKISFIIQRNMEYRELFREVEFKIEISSKYTNIIRENNVLKIPVEEMIEYDFNGVDFIAEDFNDIEYLDQAIRAYKISDARLGNFITKYNKVNGGGNNIPNVYSYHLNKKTNLVVCLCDSDKFSPNGPLGSNASECRRISRTENLTYLFITEGREIENDIPHFFIESAFSNDPKTTKSINELPIYKNNICQYILDHSDLKKGVSLSWVDKMPKTSENEKYWASCARIIRENLWYRGDEENIVLIPYVSGSLLKNVTNFLKKRNDMELKQILLEIDELNRFMNMGKNLFWIMFSFNEKKFVA